MNKDAESPPPPAQAPDEERPLELLADTAALALEGEPRTPERPPPRRPFPLHASRMLARLFGVERPYAGVEDFLGDLSATRDRLVRVGRGRRLVHALMQVGFLVLALMGMMVFVSLIQWPTSMKLDSVVYWAALVTLGLVVCLWTRGGPSFRLCGLTLVRSNGQPARRWQLVVRCLLVWGYQTALFFAIAPVQNLSRPPGRERLGVNLNTPAEWAAAIAVILFGVLTVVAPRRALHNWIVRTHVVPE
jgi:hypothetical protein